MNYERYVLNEKERQIYYMGAIALLFFFGYLFYRHLGAMIFMAWGSKYLEPWYCAWLAEKRRRTLMDQFRDFLYSVGASIGGGRQMEEAIEEAEKSLRLAYDEEAILCKELSAMVQGIRESQQSVDRLLMDFASRSGLADIRQFVHVYCICKTTGADLQTVIQKTVEVLLDKINFKREIRVITAQKRMEANVLTGISLGMIACLNVISPQYLSVLYHTVAGRVVMTMALVGMGGAYAWSMKLTKIELD